ncbi:glucarate transporter [Sphingomonas turrisvirgatae]|uniref:Glucarate transporter n=1 Tax=Sphingomonas turrisvirgatae TaxID=1888892 RepID=A0A1E3LU93_9SPHN|nr:glucarate transporter [Sphingomonas turrisvirgatae]
MASDARPTHVRYAIIALIFIITSVNYADRATFSIAGSQAAAELGIGAVQTGFILSAFAWAYVLAQVPGGLLLDKFGTKRVYAAAIALWSIFTALQGLAGLVAFLPAVAMLFALRFLVGLAEAPSFPGNARLVASWFPSAERGTASAIFNSAQYFSLVAFAPLMGWLAHSFGWRSIFWVMGALGLVATAVFVRFIHSPARHPSINQAELDHIEAGGGLVHMDEGSAGKAAAFDWGNVGKLIANRMMLGIYLGQYCINVLTYFFVTWFPIYLVKERGLNIMEAGFAAAAPALCGFAGGLAGGFVSDLILKRTGSLDLARKGPLTVGMLLATAIIACVWAEQEWLVVTLMSVAFFGKGIASLGWAVMADVAPKRLAGLSGGVFNMFGNVAGIVTPIVVGVIVASTGSFDWALVYVGAHCLLTIFAFLVIAGPIKRMELGE